MDRFTTAAASLPQLTWMDDILLGPMATPWGDFTETHATVDDAIAAAKRAWGLGGSDACLRSP
ncbi:hypothetical protein ACFWXK_25005 [Streptomyces sp. NPDC059070]|uniref:hypothetical protein n=1 Tax=Streptomyces sp. NPDC059070 TaxID=3346713 RepID=UPI003677C0A8